jgi:hypothetical protein
MSEIAPVLRHTRRKEEGSNSEQGRAFGFGQVGATDCDLIVRVSDVYPVRRRRLLCTNY